MTPGEKFSCTMSLTETSRFASSTPRGERRFNVQERLFRFM